MPVLANPVQEPTLLKTFMRLTDIKAQQVADRLRPGTVSEGALSDLINGKRVSRAGTLVLVLEVLNAYLRERGERPLTLEGLQHLARVRPSPPTTTEQNREIRKAYSLP